MTEIAGAAAPAMAATTRQGPAPNLIGAKATELTAEALMTVGGTASITEDRTQLERRVPTGFGLLALALGGFGIGTRDSRRWGSCRTSPATSTPRSRWPVTSSRCTPWEWWWARRCSRW